MRYLYTALGERVRWFLSVLGPCALTLRRGGFLYGAASSAFPQGGVGQRACHQSKIRLFPVMAELGFRGPSLLA